MLSQHCCGHIVWRHYPLKHGKWRHEQKRTSIEKIFLKKSEGPPPHRNRKTRSEKFWEDLRTGYWRGMIFARIYLSFKSHFLKYFCCWRVASIFARRDLGFKSQVLSASWDWLMNWQWKYHHFYPYKVNMLAWPGLIMCQSRMYWPRSQDRIWGQRRGDILFAL